MKQILDLISPQARIAAIGYFLVFASMLVTSLYTKSITSGKVLASIVFYVLISALSLYVLNCTVTGKCIIYAWVVGWLVVALGIMTILSAVISLMKR